MYTYVYKIVCFYVTRLGVGHQPVILLLNIELKSSEALLTRRETLRAWKILPFELVNRVCTVLANARPIYP